MLQIHVHVTHHKHNSHKSHKHTLNSAGLFLTQCWTEEHMLGYKQTYIGLFMNPTRVSYNIYPALAKNNPEFSVQPHISPL